ncbi:uncharacterized protein LOC129288398 [Prosopis cineraria]|uniref:uncharacterized protein LOC129288398 n=1 Tax=Prosopis cineraria TaxID=364024 RepID=UPI00240FAC98|nr:uncharacterized protein LOC129288398 [Prosopis cineraria]
MANYDGNNIVAPVPRWEDIQRPMILASRSCIRLSEKMRNYEFKSKHVKALPQFSGHPIEDPLGFIKEFYLAVSTLPLKGLTEEELKMRCFSHCMKEDAREWLLNLPEESLTTWVEVYEAFMLRFYSPHQIEEFREKIFYFSQLHGELFHETWERFKTLLNQCPHHGFTNLMLSEIFYKALTPFYQTQVDIAAGGYGGNVTAIEKMNVYEKLARNSRLKGVQGRRVEAHEVGTRYGNFNGAFAKGTNLNHTPNDFLHGIQPQPQQPSSMISKIDKLEDMISKLVDIQTNAQHAQAATEAAIKNLEILSQEIIQILRTNL